MKNPFKKKSKFPTPTAPRATEELKNEFLGLCAKAGEIQYQIDAFENDLKVLNKRMRELNLENHARQQLDKASEQIKPETAPQG